MNSINDRPTLVLDRPTRSDADVAPVGAPPDAAVPLATGSTPPAPPPARGWGSREERRLALWGVGGFFLLGLYAALFVLVGALVWS